MNTKPYGTKQWVVSQKVAHEYPHLEDFHPLVDYALSISPNNLIRSDVLTECVVNVYADIMPLFMKGTYIIRPEISTKSTILHYHGVLRFEDRDDITRFYFYMIPKLKSVCSFSIKGIDDMDVWIKYCKKQRLHMKSFCYKHNFIISPC